MNKFLSYITVLLVWSVGCAYAAYDKPANVSCMDWLQELETKRDAVSLQVIRDRSWDLHRQNQLDLIREISATIAGKYGISSTPATPQEREKILRSIDRTRQAYASISDSMTVVYHPDKDRGGELSEDRLRQIAQKKGIDWGVFQRHLAAIAVADGASFSLKVRGTAADSLTVKTVTENILFTHCPEYEEDLNRLLRTLSDTEKETLVQTLTRVAKTKTGSPLENDIFQQIMGGVFKKNAESQMEAIYLLRQDICRLKVVCRLGILDDESLLQALIDEEYANRHSGLSDDERRKRSKIERDFESNISSLNQDLASLHEKELLREVEKAREQGDVELEMRTWAKVPAVPNIGIVFLRNAIERLEELRRGNLEKLATEVLGKIKDNPDSSLDDLWRATGFILCEATGFNLPQDLIPQGLEKFRRMRFELSREIADRPDLHHYYAWNFELWEQEAFKRWVTSSDLQREALEKALAHFDDGASVDGLWKMAEFFKRSGEHDLAIEALKKFADNPDADAELKRRAVEEIVIDRRRLHPTIPW